MGEEKSFEFALEIVCELEKVLVLASAYRHFVSSLTQLCLRPVFVPRRRRKKISKKKDFNRKNTLVNEGKFLKKSFPTIQKKCATRVRPV